MWDQDGGVLTATDCDVRPGCLDLVRRGLAALALTGAGIAALTAIPMHAPFIRVLHDHGISVSNGGTALIAGAHVDATTPQTRNPRISRLHQEGWRPMAPIQDNRLRSEAR
jgi:hypothetical protein